MDKYPANVKSSGSAGPSDMRHRLIESAAGLLAQKGPGALTARNVASAAGTSTMSVYTYFGSMEHVVRGVVEEGFAMLERALIDVKPSDDAVCDVATQTAALVGFASEYAELYAVMFGTAPLGQFRLPPPSTDQRGRGQTLDRVAANLVRAIADGRLRHARATDVSFQWWSLAHGYAMLVTARYIDIEPGRGRVLEPSLAALFAGLGDDFDRATASVRKGLAA